MKQVEVLNSNIKYCHKHIYAGNKEIVLLSLTARPQDSLQDSPQDNPSHVSFTPSPIYAIFYTEPLFPSLRSVPFQFLAFIFFFSVPIF